ncbi:VOC family protein [Sneathiella limimaris]|uniref:VOC family protein n=1 Tax=Sneathiella limimaris TaxID=1964213 RepID=UPI00146DEA41|nr:VOC family protein [Sneathiella limimaris]
MSIDLGFTHIALAATDLDASIQFYEKYAGMKVVHDRPDIENDGRVVWLSDGTRPFVIVLIKAKSADPILKPFAHLGIAVSSREEVDHFADLARAEGVMVGEPIDEGPPVGYYIFLKDPDGHSLEISYGQDVTSAIAKAFQKSGSEQS